MEIPENINMQETDVINYTIPTISKDNYMEVLRAIEKWEMKGQSYICVSHAYLGSLAYHTYTQGWWRENFNNWKSFCEKALQRPYSTVAAAYNNYKFYVAENSLTLEEYLRVLSRIGIAVGTQLKTRKISSKEDLLNIVEKIESKELNLKTLEKEDEKYAFVSFRLEKEKYKHIVSLLELVEKKVGKPPSSHMGERLHNAVTFLYGLL